LARADLVPEVTITADGVFWHPVGADDGDLLVSREIFPLADSFAAVRQSFDREHEHQHRLCDGVLAADRYDTDEALIGLFVAPPAVLGTTSEISELVF